MNNLQQSIKQLINAFSVSGYEWNMDIVGTIQKIAGKKGKRVGDNLIYKFGNGKEIIFISAHMDEVGFFISQVNPKYASLVPIGDIEVKDIIGNKLSFILDGKIIDSKIIGKSKSFSDLKVYGLNKIPAGTVGTFKKYVTIEKDVVSGTSLDNKVGCLALLELMKIIKKKKLNKTVFICFACREEVGINGITSALKQINPDICIDVDAAYAKPFDAKNKKNWNIPTIGKGTAIQLIGGGFIIKGDNRKSLEKVCQKYDIPYQYEIPDASSGATNSTTFNNLGFDPFQINIPVANQHSAKSRASLEDIKNTVKLLEKIIMEI